MTQVSKRLDERFQWAVADRLLFELQAFTRAIELRLQAGDAKDATVDQAVADIRALASGRINEILLPSVERVQKIAELGFLMVTSDTPISLGLGQRVFMVAEGDARDLFIPGPFVTIEAIDQIGTYALAEVITWDKADGSLTVLVRAAFGSADPRTDWSITASAATSQIAFMYADMADASADAAAASAVATAADRIVTGQDRAQTGVDRAAASASAQAAGLSAQAASASQTAAAGSAQAAADSAGQVADKAPLNSPAFTGTPTAPTPPLGNTTTRIANMAALAAGLTDLKAYLTNGASEALDQFNEFAAAIGNDPNFAATIMTALGNRLRGDQGVAYSAALLSQFLANLRLSSTGATSFRNRLRNGSFNILQREWLTGTVTLGAGAYGHDGFKAGANGASYTYAATTAGDVQITGAGSAANSLIQVIEAPLLGDAATYTLRWVGTATARLYEAGNPAYQAGTQLTINGLTVNYLTVTGLTPNTNLIAEFDISNGKTLRLAQVEPGNSPTPFERHSHEFSRCCRHLRVFLSPHMVGAMGSGSFGGNIGMSWETPMRADPSVALRGQPKAADGTGTGTSDGVLSAVNSTRNSVAINLNFNAYSGINRPAILYLTKDWYLIVSSEIP